MARPTKQGLDYFPFDVGFFGDNKVRILITRYQSEGLAVYLYILCDIYKEGYYKSVEDMDDYIYIIADAVKTSPDKVQQIIAFLRKRAMVRIFEKDELTVCDLDAVITSHGIQKRYAEAIKSRKKSISDINRGYWLLTEEEEAEINAFYKSTKNEGFSENNPSFSEKNPDKSEKNSIKESKVKEIKEKDRSIDLSKKNPGVPSQAPETPRECDEQIGFPLIAEEKAVFDEKPKAKHKEFVRPTFDEVRAYAIKRGREDLAERFYEYFEVGDWIDSEGKPVQNWKQKFLTWEKEGRKTGIASGGEVGGAAKPKDPRWEWTVTGATRQKDEREKTRVFEI